MTTRKSKIKQFDVIGKLTLLNKIYKPINSSGKIEAFWYAICECGNTTVKRACALSSFYSKSCGCLRRINAQKSVKIAALKNRKYLEDDRESRLFNIWRGMFKRCYYISHRNKNYKIYRGKGIKICQEWHDFYNFKKWSLINGYSENFTIDRINSDYNYFPENCRWVTIAENLRNRKSKKIQY
jgi:hypothetical protein